MFFLVVFIFKNHLKTSWYCHVVVWKEGLIPYARKGNFGFGVYITKSWLSAIFQKYETTLSMDTMPCVGSRELSNLCGLPDMCATMALLL